MVEFEENSKCLFKRKRNNGQVILAQVGSVGSGDEFESVMVSRDWKVDPNVLVREAELVAVFVVGELGDVELIRSSRGQSDLHRVGMRAVSACLNKPLYALLF